MTIFTPIYFAIGTAIAGTGAGIFKLGYDSDKKHSLKRKGFVLDNKLQNGKHYPLIAYEIDNVNFTTQYKIGTKDIRHKADSIVDLKVNPNEPTDIIVQTEKSINYKRIGAHMLCFGITIIIASLVILVI